MKLDLGDEINLFTALDNTVLDALEVYGWSRVRRGMRLSTLGSNMWLILYEELPGSNL